MTLKRPNNRENRISQNEEAIKSIDIVRTVDEITALIMCHLDKLCGLIS